LNNAAGFRVSLAFSNGPSDNSRISLDQTGILTPGASIDLYGHLAAGQEAGVFTNVIAMTFADSSSLLGASTNLGTSNVTLVGSIYTGKGVWTSVNGGNWKDLGRWESSGGTPGIDGSLSINDSATFGSVGSGSVTLNTNVSIAMLTFSNAVDPYTIIGSGTITLKAGEANPEVNLLAGTNAIVTALKLADVVTLNTTEGSSLVIGGNLSGMGTLVQNGVGTTILSGTNTYTGTTLVGEGVLELLNTNSFRSGSVLTISNGATLVLGMGTNSYSPYSVAAFTRTLGALGKTRERGLLGGATIGVDVTGTNVTIGSVISKGINGMLGFGVYGHGTLTMTALNTYSGTTLINEGTLQVGNGTLSGSLGTGPVVNNGSLIMNSPSGTRLNNTISGTGSVTVLKTKFGSKVVLAGTNSFSGGITIDRASVQIMRDSGLGVPGGSVTLNGGELYNTALSSPEISADRAITLGTNGGYFQAYYGTTFVVNSSLVGPGGVGIAWDSGTLQLGGSNSYAGPTTIGSTNAPNFWKNILANPTLKLGSDNALPSGNDLIFGQTLLGNSAVLDLNGFNASVGGLYGQRNAFIRNSAQGSPTLTFAPSGSAQFDGTINNGSGLINLVMNGSGTEILGGNNSKFGNALTAVNQGTIQLASGAQLGGSIQVGSNGVFMIGAGARLTQPGTLHAISGTLIDNSGLSFANSVKGTVSLTSTGVLQKSYAAGTSVAGFGATLSGLNKSFQILAGVVRDAATLTAKIVGGALDFKGTYRNGVVLAIKDSSFSINGVHNIQWYNTNAATPYWTNTVAGNTGNVENASFKDFQGSYSAFLAMLAKNHISVDMGLSSIMGAYGYDSETQTAWAVIDHNSLFAGSWHPAPDGFAAPSSAFSYALYAQTQNQRNVAKALDSFLSNPSGDRRTVVTALDQLAADQVPMALSAIMPTLYQSLSTIAFNNANAQNMELAQRLWGVRLAEGGGFSMSGLSDNFAMIQEGEGDGSKAVLDAKKDILRPGLDNHWGMFVDGNGVFAQANSGNMLPGYNAESGGVTTGLSYKWSDRFASGLYAGYEGTYAKYGGGSSLIDNAVRFGLFGTYGQPNAKGFYANALAGGAYNNYSVTRNINLGTLNRTANSTPGAGELDSMIGGGYDLQRGNFTFGPTASLQYTYLGVNAVSETGARSLDFNSGGWNTSSMLSSLGAHAAYTWNARTLPGHEIIVVPQLSLNWQHEFLQNPYDITGNLGGSGPTFSNTSATGTKDYLYTGIGVTVEFSKRWNAALFYNAAAGNNNLTSQNIFCSTGVKF
jgi:autotransporter-associated beta strand protein